MKRHLPVVRFSYVAMTVGLGLLGALPAHATISYSCDATIDATQAGTCAYLNSTLAGLYNSTFSNVNASIYIKQGVTGLGSSTPGFYNDVSYATYLAALTSHASGNAVDTAAIAALNSIDSSIYGGNNVVITSALGLALGINPNLLTGTTSGGSPCTPGTSGCYNGIITVTTPANLSSETGGTQILYWNQTGGSQPNNAYDFYSIVEHETNEILGTTSCVDTQTNPLSNPCASNFGAGTPSANDLFRYAGVGSLVNLHNALSTAPGQYFSYNGGVTNGANGSAFNTLDNGNDYADFATNCKEVQDATACLGTELDITTDGKAEINMLDAVGFNLSNPVPEPGTISLFVVGLAGLVAYGRRRRA